MIRWLYEQMTGQPWTTTRCASVEFGPSPGAKYQKQLAAYSDAELYRRGWAIVAELRAQEADHRQLAAVGARAR